MLYSLLRIKHPYCGKHPIIAAISLFLLVFSASALFAEDKLTVIGVFPNVTRTEKVILKPQQPISPCTPGTVYVDSNGDLQTCDGTGVFNSAIWAQTGNDIYTKDNATVSRDQQHMSVGNNNAWSQFNIYGTNADGETAAVHFLTSDNLSNTGLVFRNNGTTIDPSKNYAASIDFHVGDRGKTYDARMIYINRSSGQKGFSFRGGFNVNNIWIDALTHYVGIGTNNPSQRLEINGDIEANKIFLNSDGVTAELRTEYGDGGHYAVYAP